MEGVNLNLDNVFKYPFFFRLPLSSKYTFMLQGRGSDRSKQSCLMIRPRPHHSKKKYLDISFYPQFITSIEGISYCSNCKYQVKSNSRMKISKGYLAKNRSAVHEVAKYPCSQCTYQATSKESLARHKRSVHEEVKHPCSQCNHQATTKGDLTRHQRVVHERVKYPCSNCDYQATKTKE